MLAVVIERVASHSTMSPIDAVGAANSSRRTALIYYYIIQKKEARRYRPWPSHLQKKKPPLSATSIGRGVGGRQGPQRLPSDSFSPLSTYRAHRTFSSSCSRCLTFGGWIKHLADWIRSPSFSSLLIDSRTAGRLLIDDFVSGIICAGRLLSHSPGSIKPEKRGKPKRRMGSATERARHIHLALSRRVSFFLRRKKKDNSAGDSNITTM